MFCKKEYTTNQISKVHNVKNKSPHAPLLIHINQYNTSKQILQKKINVNKKIQYVSSLVTTA